MDALLLVDLQNDFLPGGSLAVPEGNTVLSFANRLCTQFAHVVASQDWHPADHQSFADQHTGLSPGDVIPIKGNPQILWPRHCVQNTPGAAFSSRLNSSTISHVSRKGTDREIDSYSAFFDNGHLKATDLHEVLQTVGIERLVVLGLATDYCVKYTVLDALKLGYQVTVIKDGVRGVNLVPGDSERALVEMVQQGARLLESGNLFDETGLV